MKEILVQLNRGCIGRGEIDGCLRQRPFFESSEELRTAPSIELEWTEPDGWWEALVH